MAGDGDLGLRDNLVGRFYLVIGQGGDEAVQNLLALVRGEACQRLCGKMATSPAST
ncbi:MAG: hypothetical protein OSB73_04635 [Candidatus Latescibacteria bacterium]|nr:hypothetical protein [Candidatus Latescibacterota bacterium]